MDLPAVPSNFYPSISVTSAAAQEPSVSTSILAAAIFIFIYISISNVLPILGATLSTILRQFVAVVLMPLHLVEQVRNTLFGNRSSAQDYLATACAACFDIRAELEDDDEVDIDELIDALDRLQRKEELTRIALNNLVKHLGRVQSRHNAILAQVNAIGLMALDMGKALDNTTSRATAYADPSSAHPPCLYEDPTGYIQWAQMELGRMAEEIGAAGIEVDLAG